MKPCLYPRTIIQHNRDHTEKWIMEVPCGRCPNCLANRRDDWCVRLKEEVKASVTAWCVTLTYDDDHLVYREPYKLPVLCKEHPQKWIRAIRDYFGHDYPIRYFCVGEYGSKSLRPHYHIMIFNVPWNSYTICKNDSLKFWPYGTEDGCHVDVVDEATIRYCSKYCLKRHDYGDELPYMRPLMSKGIGSAYLSPDRKIYHRNALTDYIIQDGYKSSLPRYYRKRLFDDDMLDQIMKKRVPRFFRSEKECMEKDLQVQGWSSVRNLPRDVVLDNGQLLHISSREIIVNTVKDGDNELIAPDVRLNRDYRRELAENIAKKIAKVKNLNNSI